MDTSLTCTTGPTASAGDNVVTGNKALSFSGWTTTPPVTNDLIVSGAYPPPGVNRS